MAARICAAGTIRAVIRSARAVLASRGGGGRRPRHEANAGASFRRRSRSILPAQCARVLSSRGLKMEKLLADDTALVTGGAGGIGFAIAAEMAREGARVAIADIDADAGQAAA